LYGEAVRGSLL